MRQPSISAAILHDHFGIVESYKTHRGLERGGLNIDSARQNLGLLKGLAAARGVKRGKLMMTTAGKDLRSEHLAVS